MRAVCVCPINRSFGRPSERASLVAISGSSRTLPTPSLSFLLLPSSSLPFGTVAFIYAIIMAAPVARGAFRKAVNLPYVVAAFQTTSSHQLARRCPFLTSPPTLAASTARHRQCSDRPCIRTLSWYPDVQAGSLKCGA